MFGDRFELEGGEGVGEEWDAAVSGFPVQAGESVGAGRGRASGEPLVLSSEERPC